MRAAVGKQKWRAGMTPPATYYTSSLRSISNTGADTENDTESFRPLPNWTSNCTFIGSTHSHAAEAGLLDRRFGWPGFGGYWQLMGYPCTHTGPDESPLTT